jgi:mono/diheme cytochrome c family protein
VKKISTRISPRDSGLNRICRDLSPLQDGVHGRIFPLMLMTVGLLIFGASRAPAQKSPSQCESSKAGNPANGKRVFTAQACYTCHGRKGQGPSQADTKIVGPRIGPPAKSVAAFISAVREPVGQVMPPYRSGQISDSELVDVYAFLRTMSQPAQADTSSAATPRGNAQKGEQLFTSDGCYECHGHHAEGSTATAGPRLGPNPMTFAALVEYVRHPTNQMPPYTDKVISDTELADIYAFLESLPQPPKLDNIPLLK